ncbi:PTS system mannose/fructose/sorbose family transporter subunit IID [Aerococcaceae bacterium DSM 111176]|nr:PTS system mannose/fructose/sorbose family transporter subunit IID [Aerococcaceae bacterium DSM 111176]
MTEQNNKKINLTKGDRMKVALRSQFIQANWNYERMHNVGYAFTMNPLIRTLYKNKEDQIQAAQRHLEFVNTHPYLYGPINGVVIALEEERANGTDISDEAINGVKIGMMGPLAGIGDPVFWGTLRPVIGAFAASMALSQSILGPIIFFVAWNVIRWAFIWYTQELGYRSGTEITKDLGGGILQKITTGASILGMFVMGVLVPRWTSMNFPLVISEIENDPASIVDFQGLVDQANNNAVTVEKFKEVLLGVASGQNVNETTVQTLGEIFNQLIPGLMPLLLTFFAMYLLRKNVKSLYIILFIFVLGIAMYALGIMG